MGKSAPIAAATLVASVIGLVSIAAVYNVDIASVFQNDVIKADVQEQTNSHSMLFDQNIHLHVMSNTCASDEYDDNGVCRKCHWSCTTCSGSSTHCTSCRNSWQFLNECGRCVDDVLCRGDQYPDYSSFSCGTCHSACKTCYGPSEWDCITCETGFMQMWGTCVPDTSMTLPTATSCGPKQYLDGDVCRDCHWSCASCDAATGSGVCTACAEGEYLTDCGTCVTECPHGFWANESAHTCEPCSPTCQTCGGPTENDCWTCGPGTHWEASTGEGTCKPCMEGCKHCVAGDHCYECLPGWWRQDEYKCVTECPEGQYPNHQTGECGYCHDFCKSCYGPSNTECTSCHYWNTQVGNICYEDCITGWFSQHQPDDTWACAKCDSKCHTCADRPDLCLSCRGDDSWYYHANCITAAECSTINGVGWCTKTLDNGDQVCVDCNPPAPACPEGQYWSDVTNGCEMCHGDCKTCGGPTENDCWSCREGMHWEYTPNGEGMCWNCMEGCDRCVASDHCYKCSEGWWRQDETVCVQQCPDGQYPDPADGECRYCHDFCATCHGPGPNKCDSCHPWNTPEGSTCHEGCIEGWFHADATEVCTKCADKCHECTDVADLCMSCRGDLYFWEDDCVPSCPDHFCPMTLWNGNNVCEDCTALGKDPCPVGFYYGDNANGVEGCHRLMPGCDKGPSLDHCDKCSEGWYRQDENICVETCPDGQFADWDGECRYCHDYCKRCNGATNLSCLECQPWTYYDESSGRCLEMH